MDAPDNPNPLPDPPALRNAVADDEPAGGSGGITLSSGALATIGGGALLAIFMIQNKEDVTLEFLFWDFTWRLWFLVLLSAAVGALIWLGLGIMRRHRRRQARRAARQGVIPDS